MPYSQENRLIAIDTPLGKDVLLLVGMTGTEGLSQLFSFELSLISENQDISFDQIIGKNVTVSMTLADGNQRIFNGIVSRFAQGKGGAEAGGDPRFSYYSATMVPWFWLLTRTADARIFQKLSVPDIVEKVFSEKGMTDFSLRLQGSYEQREYCVQYRETYFNFISRLLEEEGIYYFFEHEEGKHTMVMADSPVEHKPCQHQETAKYQISAGGWLDEDVITGLARAQEIRSGKYSLSDYNFEIPNTDLLVNVASKKKLGPGDREVYDYPGRYTKRDRGDHLATVRMEEEEARITTLEGTSDCRAFSSGYRFNLAGHYRGDTNNKDYVLTFIEHGVSLSGDYPGAALEGSDFAYKNSFTCIPFDVSFRPPCNTLKPVVRGTQTAFVVGPSGEEIYTDEHGRIKVQFQWDREGKMDEKSSCWIRVGQMWASAKWGSIFIPRIGQEVIVDFLEGDPDRPIVIGCVYHGNNKPPYDLPDHKTRSTIKSWSSKEGQGFNEIRFEDKKGKEQIFIHAESNQDIRIKNDLYEWVGRDSHLIVKRDQLELIEGDKHLSVRGDHNEKTDGTFSIQAGMDMQEKAGIKHALEAGTEIHLKAGMNIVLEAGMSITLKAGGGFIVVGPAGVTISGTPVLINSGGAAGAGSGCSPAYPIEPKEADTAEPGEKAELPPPKRVERGAASASSAQKKTLQQAAQSGTPFCEL